MVICIIIYLCYIRISLYNTINNVIIPNINLNSSLLYFSEEMLILFYHSCFFDMEQTRICIEIYYTLKTETPEFFANRDVFRPELVNALNVL